MQSKITLLTFEHVLYFQDFIEEHASSVESSTGTPTSMSSPVPPPGSKANNEPGGGSRPASRRSNQSPFQPHQHSSSPFQNQNQGSPLHSGGGRDPERPRHVVHISTKDFPHFFAIVSRPRQDVAAIGPEGTVLSSQRVPTAQVYTKPK